MNGGGDTIWELVRQASEALPEPFGHRTPLLVRIGHGEYRRYRPGTAQRPDGPAPSMQDRKTSGSEIVSADVVLVGCSSSKAATARPAADQPARRGAMCPTCFTEMPVAGHCTFCS